ncbi:MAG: hypothetical protein Q9190_004129 [Brigantiaea leucoxantha]
MQECRASMIYSRNQIYQTTSEKAVYKAAKVTANGDVKTNGKATVEDEQDEDEDVAAGPELPPDEEEDAIDEEGRFFGGGINHDTADVLDFIDERDKDDAMKTERIDAAWVRKLALNFEKKISKNSELRAKFDDDPPKFMSSEADLDAEIKALSILSEYPSLYEEFVKLGCASSLVSLLSHENTDIAIDAIEIINELTDEAVEAEVQQWDVLVDAMLDSDLLSLLYENISRFDEALESDRAGVYHILSVLETLSFRPAIASSLLQSTSFLPWLLRRIQAKEPAVSQNKQYAAEILSILVQSSTSNVSHFISTGENVDIILQLLAPYRKHDPEKGTNEEEYVENLFSILSCCVNIESGKSSFLASEGIELALIMLRDKTLHLSKSRSLRVLNHCLSGSHNLPLCERFIDAAGLKPLFRSLLRSGAPAKITSKPKPKSKLDAKEDTEHILGILFSLLRTLPADSPPRIRLLAKFVETDYQALPRIISIRRECASRLSYVEREIGAERAIAMINEEEIEDLADEWLSRRLDAGLYSLQTADVILAWLVAEDVGAAQRIRELLAEKGEGLGDVRRTLEEQLAGMEASREGGGGKETTEDAEDTDADAVVRDMLSTLMTFL